MRGISISAGTSLQLYINYPHWRLSVALRLFTTLLAATTVTCDTFILRWKPLPTGMPWWNFQLLNTGIPFVVCSLSIIWAITSLIKLFASLKPMHPGADIGVDLFISMLLAPTIVFAILGPANHWRSTGKHGLGTVAGKLELAAIVSLIIMLPIHFAFFVWACRRVDVKRRLKQRESCDRCLTMRLRGDLAWRGSDIEPMPSREYYKIQDDHIRVSPTATSPTHDISHNTGTPSTPSTATLPCSTSSSSTETAHTPYPLVGDRYHELDVEQKHIPYQPTSPRSPRYQFEDSDDDETTPPTPPPKLHYRKWEERPPMPRLNVGQFKRPYGSKWPGDDRRDDPRLGAPSRAYSISSYYYSNGSEV